MYPKLIKKNQSRQWYTQWYWVKRHWPTDVEQQTDDQTDRQIDKRQINLCSLNGDFSSWINDKMEWKNELKLNRCAYILLTSARLGIIRSPAATMLWNTGHTSMLVGTPMWSVPIVVLLWKQNCKKCDRFEAWLPWRCSPWQVQQWDRNGWSWYRPTSRQREHPTVDNKQY